MSQPDDEEIELYGDPRIESFDRPVPAYLKWTYFILPIWAVITFFLYLNGSWGWLDRGYWKDLQAAAKTSFPIQQYDSPKE